MTTLRDLPPLCDDWATTRDGQYEDRKGGHYRSKMPERMWHTHRCTNFAKFRITWRVSGISRPEFVCGVHKRQYDHDTPDALRIEPLSANAQRGNA